MWRLEEDWPDVMDKVGRNFSNDPAGTSNPMSLRKIKMKEHESFTSLCCWLRVFLLSFFMTNYFFESCL